MKRLICASALAAVVCGCVTVNQNDGGSDTLRPPVVKDVVHQKYTIENNLVSAKDHVNCLFGFIIWGSSATHIADAANTGHDVVNAAKNGAYANACDAAKCDALMGSHYKITVNDYFVFADATAEIKGYPAKMSGVEVIENKDPANAKSASSDAASGFGLDKLSWIKAFL